jgi:tetrahydromethanopterin S-methyltransferase subunit D
MMDPLLMIGSIAVAGVLIGGGVHFLPVGGAPAAIATATGVGTGTAMLAAGSAMTGLITAAAMTGISTMVDLGIRSCWFHAYDRCHHDGR